MSRQGRLNPKPGTDPAMAPFRPSGFNRKLYKLSFVIDYQIIVKDKALSLFEGYGFLFERKDIDFT
jgi:hypothetical protein